MPGFHDPVGLNATKEGTERVAERGCVDPVARICKGLGRIENDLSDWCKPIVDTPTRDDGVRPGNRFPIRTVSNPTMPAARFAAIKSRTFPVNAVPMQCSNRLVTIFDGAKLAPCKCLRSIRLEETPPETQTGKTRHFWLHENEQ
ncbi:MAG: hypothetical protein ACR2RA_18715 [Geminicoccaceae bacterium]